MNSAKDLVGLSRSSIANQMNSLIDSIVRPKPHNDMHGLTEENKLAWIFRNVANLGNTHYPYQQYPKPAINNGVFRMQNDTAATTYVALLSDWASDTFESRLVAQQVGTQDYSIHLGDTYYVGNSKEIANNFNTDFGGSWPYGKQGSFALLGNHEMYSSGRSYFTQLLPYMGNYVVNHDKNQQASFFCLENDNWRIIGLDTGYYSLKGLLGLKGNNNLDLHDAQKEWLRNTVRLNEDKRGLIILSHHQCFSAFEDEFPKPAEFIASLLPADRNVIWLWGHEHWFSVYGANKLANGSTMYARCVGNSGMPVELNKKKEPKAPKNSDTAAPENHNLVLFDNRQREVIDNKVPLGYNGFAILGFTGNQLTISYFDDNDKQDVPRKILEEVWQVDMKTGKLAGTSIQDFTAGGTKKLKLFGKNLQDAIR